MGPLELACLVRVVGHIDVDYFFAQVEEVLNPALRTRPVVVCVYSGRSQSSGVVSTANYLARSFGVSSGMSISAAQKRLSGTNAEFIPMKQEKYKLFSERVMQIVREHVDTLEQTGIDEAFFDITRFCDEDYGSARITAVGIKNRIRQAEGLTVSIGIGKTKSVAKIASAFTKPDGLTIVEPSKTIDFLSPLSVTKLYGVGPKTASLLESIGIRTIGELATSNIDDITRLLGRKLASRLHDAANGADDEPVVESQKVAQFSRIITLRKDASSVEEAYSELLPAVKELAARMDSEGYAYRTLTVIGILSNLSVRTKSRSFETPVSSPFVLSEQTLALLSELFKSVQAEFRRVGVRVSDLVDIKDQASLNQYL